MAIGHERQYPEGHKAKGYKADFQQIPDPSLFKEPINKEKNRGDKNEKVGETNET